MSSAAQQASGPTVALSYAAAADLPDDYRHGVLELANAVVDRLRARGVDVVAVNAADPERDSSELLTGVDGVVVMGGVDIDPAVYGEEVTADNVHFTNRAADEYEVGLIRDAAEGDAPVLGICRGSQLINVAFGGSLIQDLGPGIHVAAVPGGDEPLEDVWTNHAVVLGAGTRLAGMLTGADLDVRVGHHQAVGRVGEGLVVAARAEDGVVEAVEAAEGWVVGVQWHPEEAKSDPEVLDRLLDGFLGAIGARSEFRA